MPDLSDVYNAQCGYLNLLIGAKREGIPNVDARIDKICDGIEDTISQIQNPIKLKTIK